MLSIKILSSRPQDFKGDTTSAPIPRYYSLSCFGVLLAKNRNFTQKADIPFAKFPEHLNSEAKLEKYAWACNVSATNSGRIGLYIMGYEWADAMARIKDIDDSFELLTTPEDKATFLIPLVPHSFINLETDFGLKLDDNGKYIAPQQLKVETQSVRGIVAGVLGNMVNNHTSAATLYKNNANTSSIASETEYLFECMSKEAWYISNGVILPADQPDKLRFLKAVATVGNGSFYLMMPLHSKARVMLRCVGSSAITRILGVMYKECNEIKDAGSTVKDFCPTASTMDKLLIEVRKPKNEEEVKAAKSMIIVGMITSIGTGVLIKEENNKYWTATNLDNHTSTACISVQANTQMNESSRQLKQVYLYILAKMNGTALP